MHRRELFGEDSLATHGLLSEDDRRAQLARLDSRYTERMNRARLQRFGPAPQAERGLPPSDLEQPGAYLKRSRELKGLTLRDMYERTRLSTLEAIEREAFESLPPEPYLGRHVFEYARALGVRETIYLRLRHPQAKSIRSVTVNGVRHERFDPAREWVVLPGDLRGVQSVVAQY